MSYFDSIIDNIPRLSYKYLASGQDSNGKTAFVFVLADGYDQKALEGIL